MRGFAAHDRLGPDAWILPSHRIHDVPCGIFEITRREDDLEVLVLQTEEALETLLQSRLGSVDRLQHADGWVRTRLRQARSRAPARAKSTGGDDDQPQVH